MLKRLGVVVALVCGSATAWADAKSDCDKRKGDIAIKACTELIRRDPKNADAYFNRALAYDYDYDYDYDRAIADFSKAIEIDLKAAGAYIGRGDAYRAKREYDRAIADYNMVIEIAPQSGLAYFNRGLSYKDKGEHDLAIADFSKLLEFQPKSNLAYFNRGVSYKYKGEYDRAIADFNKAIEIDPKWAFAYYERGNTYLAKGERDSAIADYKRALVRKRDMEKADNALKELGITIPWAKKECKDDEYTTAAGKILKILPEKQTTIFWGKDDAEEYVEGKCAIDSFFLEKPMPKACAVGKRFSVSGYFGYDQITGDTAVMFVDSIRCS